MITNLQVHCEHWLFGRSFCVPQSCARWESRGREAVLSCPRAHSRSAEWFPWKKGTCVFHVCLLKDPDVTEAPLCPFHPRCPAASTTARMQQLKSRDFCNRICSCGPGGPLVKQTATLMAVPKTKPELSLHPFILTQENKVVKSRPQLYNINTLQLPCIHTNMKRLEPSYFLYKLDITQLWSRYAYPFLSETFQPKINIPLAQLNVFIETYYQHFTAHLKNRCLQPIK